MGNHKSIFISNKNHNNINTEGTQGIMTINSDKASKKNNVEIIYRDKNRNKNLYSKRESVDVLLTNNKEYNKNINTIPTENNEIIRQNINIAHNSINYNKLNKHITDNNTIEPIEKENKKLKNDAKKIQFNNITIVDNLSNYFPKNISKEEINEMVKMALNGYIIEDPTKYVPGQNITIEHVELLGQYIYENINKNKNNNKMDYSIIEQINVRIGMSELNKDLIEKIFFRGRKISKIQSDIIIKNLSKGNKGVKALYIELL